jgi:hypothetical protein
VGCGVWGVGRGAWGVLLYCRFEIQALAVGRLSSGCDLTVNS